MSPARGTGDTAQTLARGLDVLDAVAASTRGLTLTELGERLSVGRTVTHRLVSTLVERRLLYRGDGGRYLIGVGAARLIRSIQQTLRDAARAELDLLAADLGATAHLAVAEGDEAVAVAVAEPLHTTFHIAYRTGTRTPLGVGALGAALLAARSGRAGTFESEGQLTPGAKGVVAAVPGMVGLPCAVGVVTLAPVDTSTWHARVAAAAAAIGASLSAEQP
ncbi:helix-turn-helix domain-containing protein [Skermania piniformis]|uniref:Helix-turn-helix domain-containing protein n=1 Tax=Skermania pinensis TaxID=39122 RepID=A0ABX8S6N9_9ACTN|nr:helix-turn-helix domain-containing protein [Skermania piniformis]QXQ12664.1 helix-turn-helix domain-containing protein [Skermania piniformis]